MKLLRYQKTALALIVGILFSCSHELQQVDLTHSDMSILESSNSFNLVSSISNHHYVQNLDIVLGDVKQGQIYNLYTTTTEIDNILDGFESMGVGGIRITIFAEGVNPNKPMFDYFYTEAKARGFKIFANPMEYRGGQKIANGMGPDQGTGPSVLGSTTATETLINRVIDFAQEYAVDWICPFNEDGGPGKHWTAAQMNTIFSSVHAANLNGAQLIGPCTYGIPEGIAVLNNTNIKDYISIATTHNLGFHHDKWPDFIAAAGPLPVWDSETNNRKKFPDKDVRIDAAINAGVDGLVLYNSLKGIDWTDGTLTGTGVNANSGQDFKDKITQYYFVQNKETGDRIKPYTNFDNNSLIVEVPSYWNGVYSQWELVPVENGWYRLKNRGGGTYVRPETNNDFSNILSKTSFYGTALHVQWRTNDAGNGFVFIENRGTGKVLNARNYDDLGNNNDVEVIKIQQVPNFWTGNWSQWQLIEAN
ncbi:RICIN domain-containing protein [Flagellimonas sp. MMG031]|uniref:RICIN domain-containing protein n=1 Tax=Flagellimonas sp. MMG031 TaxID=3158549 RepID=A0AAU7MX16_9FLAO